MSALILILLHLFILGACDFDSNYFYYDLNPPRVHRPKGGKLPVNWCALPCENEKHVACTHGNCKTRSPCVKVNLDKEQILFKHNTLRNKFAVGREKATEGVTVANMMGLKWDDDLAFTAKCNLVTCENEKEDMCHKTPIFPIVGQNVWSFNYGINEDCAAKTLDAIQSWYDELIQATPEEMKELGESYKGVNVMTRHFTQLIWAATTHVGCAATKRDNQMMGTKCMVTCNYGPGVQKKSRAFHEGVPCSECPDLYCQINGLCWTPEVSKGDEDTSASSRTNPGLLIVLVFLVHKCFI